MYIHDVIGALREKDLHLQREIHALRLAIHMLEVHAGLTTLGTEVSRETNEPEGDSNGHPTLF